MMNKELKSILLKENFCCEDLEVSLETDYKETVKEMFNILLDLLKDSTNEEIDLVMSNIELFVETSDNIDYKIVNNAVREANYKLNSIKSNMDNRVLKNIKFRLIDLNRKINISREKVDNLNIFNFYHYLIFEERNINMVELLLKTENNILSKKDDYGNDLFNNIIDNYCSLEETDELVDYYYEVINLFLKYLEDKLIKSERQKYIQEEIARIEKEIEEIAKQEEIMWNEYRKAKEEAKKEKLAYLAEKRKAKEEAKAKKHNHDNQPSETTEDTTPSDNTTEVEIEEPKTDAVEENTEDVKEDSDTNNNQ